MGKFQKGQSGNPAGRPARAVEDATQSVLRRVFDAEAEERVIRTQILIASDPDKKGATVAAKWLFDRKYGPVQAPEPEDPDITVHVVYEDE